MAWAGGRTEGRVVACVTSLAAHNTQPEPALKAAIALVCFFRRSSSPPEPISHRSSTASLQ